MTTKSKFSPRTHPNNQVHVEPKVAKKLPEISQHILTLSAFRPVRPKFSIKDLSLNYLQKIKKTMQTDLGNTVNFVKDVEDQIEELNVPILKYMDPESNGQHTLKNITPILKKDYPLLKCDPKDFKSQYKAKDFYGANVKTSRSSSQNSLGYGSKRSSCTSLLLPQIEPQTDRHHQLEERLMMNLESINQSTISLVKGRHERHKSDSMAKKVELIKYQGQTVAKNLVPAMELRKKLVSALRKGNRNLKKIVKETEDENNKKPEKRIRISLLKQQDCYSQRYRGQSDGSRTFR